MNIRLKNIRKKLIQFNKLINLKVIYNKISRMILQNGYFKVVHRSDINSVLILKAISTIQL